jgi:predicted metal-dependent enzyme (double-stranded beta helix superfamily)
VFDVDAFVADLVACGSDSDPRAATKELLARTLASSSADVAESLAPVAGGITLLHHSPELTIANIAWAPHMQLMPHDHRMWAVIGIYGGVEDNQFFRRDTDGTLATTNDRRLDTGDVCMLGTETIHAVTNPTDRLTGAVHVYGGDFVNQPRSQWGPGDLVERPFDMETLHRQFRDANDAAGLADA